MSGPVVTVTTTDFDEHGRQVGEPETFEARIVPITTYEIRRVGVS